MNKKVCSKKNNSWRKQRKRTRRRSRRRSTKVIIAKNEERTKDQRDHKLLMLCDRSGEPNNELVVKREGCAERKSCLATALLTKFCKSSRHHHVARNRRHCNLLVPQRYFYPFDCQCQNGVAMITYVLQVSYTEIHINCATQYGSGSILTGINSNPSSSSSSLESKPLILSFVIISTSTSSSLLIFCRLLCFSSSSSI